MHLKGTAQLRELLRRDGVVVAPGCHDAFGARIVSDQGFEAVYMSGNATSAARLGKPDLGLLSLTEMVSHARGIATSVGVPLIADADTGHGHLGMVARTIEEFEAAGVAGVHLEDQTYPRRFGAANSSDGLVQLDEACARISVALAARTDPDFVIIARTDALCFGDYDAAIERARAFADLGADLVMVEGARSQDEVRAIARDLRGLPLMTNCFEFWQGTLLPVCELEELGYKVVIFSIAATLAYGHAVEMTMQAIRTTGATESMAQGMFSKEEYEATLGGNTTGTGNTGNQ